MHDLLIENKTQTQILDDIFRQSGGVEDYDYFEEYAIENPQNARIVFYSCLLKEQEKKRCRNLKDFWINELRTGNEFYRIKSEAESYHEFAYPMGYAMENTTYCNAKCTFCTHEKLIREGDRICLMLQIDEAKYRIRKLKLYQLILQPDNPGLLDVTGFGESFINPDFFQILEYAKKFWNEILVTTNGSLLEEKTIRRFMQMDLPHLDMSLCYFDKNSYEGQLKLPYDTTLENMQNVFLIRNAMNARTQLKIHIFDNELNSEKDRIEFKNLFGKLARPSDYVYTRNYDENVENGLHTKNRKREIGRCFPLYEQLVVDVDGHILPCCASLSHRLSKELCCGNITDEIGDVLRKINKIRDEQKRGIFIDICQSCSLAYEYHVQDIYNMEVENLLDFCKCHSRLLIYGAGDIGGRISRWLHFNGIDFEGYVVSDQNGSTTKYGKKIYDIKEIVIKDYIGIIVAVSEKYKNEIIDVLSAYGFNERDIFIQDMFE